MNQICTNKEQSSRLLEAGVRPDTADGDDYSCNISDDDLWMSIPEFN